MFAVLSFWLQSGGGAGNLIASFLPFILIFLIFYFLHFLPTQRRQKQQRQMLANLKNGDRVVTTGGLRGTIVGLKDEFLYLRDPPQDVRLEISRSAVSGLLNEEEKKPA